MSKDTLGEFEALVLLAALRLDDEAYGLSIAEEIEATAGRVTLPAAVYVTLRRLEKKGLVESRWESDDEAEGRRARRLVRVTPEGLGLVRQSVTSLRKMTSGLEARLEEA